MRALRGKDEAKAAYHQGQVDLLVPLVKAYGSDQGFRVCETAIQTYGGVGYTKDFPVEQYCRDAKIFSIYEGTNHIQAMDLVGRKLGQARRREPAGVPRRRRAVRAEALGRPDARAPRSRRSALAQEALGGSAMRLLMWFQTGNVGHGAAARQPLPRDDGRDDRRLAAARGRGDRAREEEERGGRVTRTPRSTTARSPRRCTTRATCSRPSSSRRKLMAEEDKTPLDIPDAAFATV